MLKDFCFSLDCLYTDNKVLNSFFVFVIYNVSDILHPKIMPFKGEKLTESNYTMPCQSTQFYTKKCLNKILHEMLRNTGDKMYC